MIPPPSPAVTAPTMAETPGATAQNHSGSATPVLGDGTTLATRSRRRWLATRGPVLGLAIVLVFVVLASLLSPRTSQLPFAPDNPKPDGARALAQVLGDRGVTVHFTRSRTDVLERARPGTTLAIFNSQILPQDLLESLASSRSDLALFEPSSSLLESASQGGLEPARAPALDTSTRAAGCSDDVGRAVGAITSSGANYRATDDADGSVTLCFPAPDAAGPSGSYAQMERTDGARVDVVDDQLIVTNSVITSEGNAALALRMLGQNDTLVWYLPDPADLTESDDAPSGLMATLPSQTVPLIVLAGFVVLALMFARGRRLGPVVTEPLPVLVQAAEATRGRGRLYRRSRSYGHAAAALRAGAGDRLAGRVGLPRSASAVDLIDALARATGHPNDHIAGLLYGPPPTNDIEFVRLSAALDQLENEVYHP